ncbi:unnamed protein product [Tilletia controversa]|nr:unnamed protein product [Tilletia controversa]
MSSDAPSNSALGQPFEGAGKSSPGETENRLGDLSLGEGGDQRAGSPSLLPSRNGLDRSRSPSSHAGLSSPGERTQQGLGSTAHLGVQRRSPSPQPGSPFSFPCTSSASSTPVGTPTLPSASLPVFSTSGGPPGRSNSLSGVSSPDPFNFAGSPSLSNRPLEAAKHQHHRSRSINMGGFSPVMKGGKLINFGSGPVSISAPGGESGSSWEGSSSNPGSPLSSSPVNGSGLGPGFDPSALVAGGSSTPRAPSPLQQSHTAISSSNLMDIESSAHSGASGSSTSPTILPHFSSSPSGSSISHNHRDSRTIDFATAVKGWESPLFTVTTLPPPIPIGQHSLSSLRAAAAASERARSPKPLSLGEAHGTAGGMMGAPSLSPDRASQNGSASSGSAHYNGPSRKTSGSFTKHPVVEHAHDSILTSPKFKSIPLTSLSPSSPPKAAVASSGVSLSNISRPISPRINAWPSGSSHVSPGSSPSGASFHFGSNPGSRLHRPTSPSIRLEHDGRGRTPSPSRARDGSGISRGASLSPPLDADAQNMRMRPVSPSSWDSSWPEVSGGSRSVPIGLSSSPHGRSGGVRLERNFSNGSGSSSGGSPGTSPVASSTVFSNSATGLGIAPGAWKFPSSPRGGGKKMLSRSPRPGRDSGSSASRSRSQSPSQPLGQSDRPRNTDRDSEGSQGNPSSPVTATSSGESASNAHVSPRDLLYIRNRSVSSSSSSSGNSSEGSNGMEESSQPRRPPKRSAHGRTVSIDSAGRSSQPSGRARHARKASDPSPSLMKDPPSAMRIAHGTPRTEVDARQALSESTKGKAGAAGGLIADEVDAFSDQLPLPAIPARAHMEGSTGMSIDEADPLLRPVTSSANPSHSPMTAVAGLGSSYSLLVRPTPVDARLLPPFEASPMARMGSGNAPSNALGLGPDSMASGLHSPHNPFNTQSTLSPRLGASPLPLSERTLLGMRSRSPSPAAMIAPSPFDPLRRQSPSPSPLANTLDALNGESPPKMRSFIGMPPRSGYNLSDDPDDVGSEGDDGTASSASSTDGREGSMGGDDDDGMDEKEDDEEEGEDRTIRADSDSEDDQDSQHGMGGRRELRGLPSDISRSTLFARRQNTSSSSADGDVEDNREVHDDGSAEGSDGREQRRGMRESRAPSPPTESTEAPSRPPMYARKPSLTRSNQVLLPPELEDDDEAAGARNGRMSSALDFFHGDDPESQLDESAGWGTPLSRQISNGTRELSMVSQEDDDEDADASVSRDGDADWVPPSSQGMAPDQEDPASESEEALTTLERIFLFAKSEMTYHRILVSQCLAEWILDVKLSDAVEFIIPLLNGLSTDEHEVCENFSPELHRIMWFFFRNCPLKGQAETANGSAHVNGSAEETAIRPQLDIGTFTPLLCALLLNQNTGIARSTQNAIVQFCSRLHRDSEGTLLSDDGSWSPEMSERCEGDHTFLITSTVNRDGKDISYEPYLFGPEARKRVEEEILQNVAIAIGSQNAYQPQQEGRDSTQTTDENAAERSEAASGSASAEMSRTDSQESKGDGAGTSQETSGEVSRDDSSWDPESQMDSRMEDVWRSDGNLFDASSPQVGPVAGEFDEEAAVARMAGVTMLAALAGEGILHVDIITDKFVPQMVGLEKDGLHRGQGLNRIDDRFPAEHGMRGFEDDLDEGEDEPAEVEDEMEYEMHEGEDELYDEADELGDIPDEVEDASEEGDGEPNELEDAPDEDPDVEPEAQEEESDSEEEEEDEEGEIPEDEIAQIAARIGPAAEGDLDEAGQDIGGAAAAANGWEEAEQMGALDEELDGMLEAIGMRGPMIGLLQNAALMVVLCSFALMLFVAVPYVAGRTFGFGTNLLRLATFPIKLVRMVTDPTFDALIEWFDRFVLRPVLSVLSHLPFSSSFKAGPVAGPVVEEVMASTTAAAANVSAALQEGNVSSWPVFFDTKKALSVLEQGRERVYEFGVYMVAKTRGTSVSDRVLCVLLGHSYWLAALMLDAYFGLFQHSQQLQWLRGFVDMQHFVVKVLFFMIIELLMFPIGCGLVLDLCLSPLIESVTFGARLDEALGHPLTFFFVRWVGGTLYMFGFAQWVGATRQLLRKGALSWIRDPNDPTFSPVREILERKTMVQLKKILSSAITYAWLLIACIGINLWFIRHVWPGVLPLRWRPFNNLSAVPFDLLMLYYGMPFCIRILRPGSLIRKLSRKWWARVAQVLRLSNFLLGKDAPLEQGYVEYITWAAWAQRRGPRKAEVNELRALQHRRRLSTDVALQGDGWYFVLDGAFAHVPADDSPAPDSRVFIMVDREGVPVDSENDRALQKQEIIIANMTNKPKYEIVYLPPRFRLRIYGLFFLLWLSVSIGVQISIGGPLLIGRALFKLFTSTVQHDFYVWTIGCPVLAIPAAASYRIWHHQRRRLRRREQLAQGVHGPAERTYTVRGVCRHAAVLVYFGITIGIVIPFLIGMTTRVYLIEPWLDVSQLSKPVPVFQTWAMGLMEQVLFVRLIALQNDAWAQFLTAAIEQTVRNGVGRNVQPWRTTKGVIFPVLSGLILLLTAPPLQVGLNFALRPGPPLTPTLQQGAVRAAYKWFSFGLATAKILRMIIVRIDQWTMALKDELYLDSTELTNYTGEAGGRASEDDDGLGAVGLLPDHFI